MIPPYWNSTVTVYHRRIVDGRAAWTRSQYGRCFVKAGANRQRDGGAAFDSNDIVCRIPAPCQEVRPDDIVVMLPVWDDINDYTAGKRSSDLLEKYRGAAFTVRTVRYNEFHGIGTPHYYVGGA